MRVYKLTLMNLRILGCEHARIQASTHEPHDVRMQGCGQGYMNLKIWGCKDARMQTSAHKHKDMRMRGCNDINKPNTYIMTIYLDTSIYLIILWCKIHQTLPKILMYLQQNLLARSFISVTFSVKYRV